MQQLLKKIHSGNFVIMGILNVTPDSFSDGGEFDQVDAAVQHALDMAAEGADIIDVGGESTRPGAQPVSVEQEVERVVPVIEAIRAKSDILLSVDTSKPEVMRAAVKAGAGMVNDVNALRADGAVECCAELGVAVCLMHMKGEPRTMQQSPAYDDVVSEVKAFLQQRIEACVDVGIVKERIMVDPGFGFGKSLDHNLALLSRLGELSALKSPVLAGLSRKSMLGAILDKDVNERVVASVAAAVIAYENGARLFRVHDVAETLDALRIREAVDAI